MSRSILILLILSTLLANAQLVEVAISPGIDFKKAKHASARTQSLQPMPLPFWDDFSFRQEEFYPNDTLWESRKTVWVSNGRAINPPSLYAATLDGVNDSLGKPYDVNIVLAKGFADRLVSRPIRLDGLRDAQKDSVYLSFFYQTTGLGESPDQTDKLTVWFKDNNGSWEQVQEITNSIALRTDSFYYSIIKVESKFLHDKFQFKFQNFARLSGPYDTWNLDYIYLNANRWATDNSFPDRTVIGPITSIFEKYRAIPMDHYSYQDTATTITIPPVGQLGNLYLVTSTQPTNYYTWANIQSMKSGVETQKNFFLDSAALGFNIFSGKINTVPTSKAVPIDSIDLDADSVILKITMTFNSGDDGKNIKDPDYQAFVNRFKPTAFQRNDTTESEFILNNYYAYDDGQAEYGAGINEIGDEVAYGFPLFTKEQDTLIKVKIYFPKFAISANKTAILKVWNATSEGTPGNELYEETISVQQTAFNEFTTHTLSPALIVKGKFFIGWQQTSIGVLPVGLDKNNDAGDEIYFSLNDTWEQNQNIRGSLMIRPVFGKGDVSIPTGIAEQAPPLYPNPSKGEFYIPGVAQNVSIINMLGVELQHQTSAEESRTKVVLQNPASGVFLVRWQQNGNIYTSRLLFLNN